MKFECKFVWAAVAALLAITPVGAQVAGDDDNQALPPSAQRQSQNVAATQLSTTDSSTRYRPDVIQQSVARGEAAAARDPSGTTAVAATTIAVPSEFEAFVSEVADKQVRRFGAELLIPAARGFTAPPTTTVPPDYRLNPGDELTIGLTGSVDANDIRVTVDPEGRVFIPRVGAVVVGGLRYGNLQTVLAGAVSQQYRNFRIAVSIVRLHGITVYVTGYAATPGSYTISSLSTLVNAVLAAGGPSPGGGFRDIEVRRGGRLVSQFDLYDLLLKGDKSGDIVLQNDDVIHIGPAGPQAAVIGSVNSEAIFEARPGENFADLLAYAGGIDTVGDDTRLLLLDPQRRTGWEQLTPGAAASRPVLRGEVLRVLSNLGIARPLRDQSVLVTVSGEVASPGRFYVAPNTPLADVIAKAGGMTDQAYVFASVFTRESVRTQQRLNFDRAVRDLDLLLTARPLVSSVNDQLQPARLLAVRAVVDQLHALHPDGRIVFDVDPASTSLPARLTLENNDMLYIPPRPVTVGVFGTVPSPASFEYVPGTTLRTYLDRAGGVQPIGDRHHLFVVRANGTLIAPRRGTNAEALLRQPALPGDVIFVPIDASRGEFWARLRDLTGALFQTAIVGLGFAAVAR